MPKENDLENDTTAEVEVQEEKQPLTVEEDRRAALEAAIASTREPEEREEPEPELVAKVEPELPALQPPSEFTADEKADFLASSRKQQEASLRLHRTRTQAFSREFGSTKKLTEGVRSYLDIMGKKGLSPEEAIQKAVAMYHEFDEKPEEAVRSFLEAKKLDLSKLSQPKDSSSSSSQENNSGQSDLREIKNWIENETRSRQAQSLGEVWTRFETSKNAAGTALFPDLNNTESGIELASKIGTLISNAEYQRAFKTLNPNSTLEDMTVDAYQRLGGRIDQSEAPRSQSSHKQHITNSRRASASVPGRGAQTATNSGGKKYKTYREAAEAAVASLNSD